MLYPNLLYLVALGAALTSAQSSAQTTTAGKDDTILLGTTEAATPTGSYITYSSTITLTSSAITTEPVLSTITSGGKELTTTLGSTTILGIDTIASNASETPETTSQVILTGRPRTSTLSVNGTANATSTSAAPMATNETPCNNYVEFCSRKYSDITEVSAHNSPFVKPGNAASNQALPVTTQLNDGVRLLQAQVHFVNGTPHFCHTSCQVLDAGPITDYLSVVYKWVASHPYDIVTILLGNGDFHPVTEFVPFLEKTGLVDFAYIPSKIPMARSDWPTLTKMILSGKRVVFFMDYQANQEDVPYVLDQFSQMWETPFSPTNRSFPCNAERPPGLLPKDAQQRLYVSNHNLNYDISLLGNSLLVPNLPLLNITNSITGFGSLGEAASSCNQTWGYPPKFLNVDYYNVGNGSVFEVAAQMNNVTYNRKCCGLPVSAAIGLNDIVSRSSLLLTVHAVFATWLLVV